MHQVHVDKIRMTMSRLRDRAEGTPEEAISAMRDLDASVAVLRAGIIPAHAREEVEQIVTTVETFLAVVDQEFEAIVRRFFFAVMTTPAADTAAATETVTVSGQGD